MHDELRPVTVLFADLVGSTALGERLPPDEVKALIGECMTRMSRAVEDFGGTVQAYQGDGICALFGVPAAHADDPERAARAALRIVELVDAYGSDIRAAWGIHPFGVRVGVNTGQTAVGNVGAGAPQAVALGDTTNIGARLEALAEPGTILVGETTARRLEERFVLEERGATTVKGRDALVRTWRLVEPRQHEPGAERTALIGRDEELEMIQLALEGVAAGRGGIVLLVGDEGIGKSRLLAEAKALLDSRVVWLEASCASYGSDSLYGPFVQMLRNWIGAVEGEAEIAVRTKARAKLGATLGGQALHLLPVLGRLLGVRFDEPSGPEPSVIEAYTAWIEALVGQRPLVLVVDDAQWADSGTRSLAEELFELTDRLPLLLVIAQARLQRTEGWALRTLAVSEYNHRTTDVVLGPLSDLAAGELAGDLAPDLEPAARTRLIDQSEGNPLYLEELLRLGSEGDRFDRHRTWTVSIRTGDVLPPALENLLVARIDRLSPEARQLAQVAAIVGRVFQVRPVEQVTGDAGALTELLRAGVVIEVRRYPELECAFKHRLLQEAALSTLTPARRRELYRQVATAFESLYSDSIDEYLERLAHYHAQSDQPAAAAAYLERAAERAARLGAGDHAERLRERLDGLARRSERA